jgi:hypothetical protein
MRVDTAFGPGLFESVHEECLAHELHQQGLQFRRQVTLPLSYGGRTFPRNFTADLVVEDQGVRLKDGIKSFVIGSLVPSTPSRIAVSVFPKDNSVPPLLRRSVPRRPGLETRLRCQRDTDRGEGLP